MDDDDVQTLREQLERAAEERETFRRVLGAIAALIHELAPEALT